MCLDPYSSLTWAYQLQYYVCFQTYRRRSCFLTEERTSFLRDLLTEVCGNHDSHLIESKIYPDNVRCLLSLNSAQAIATTVQKIKTNLSREYNLSFASSPPLWARGYLARSVGRVRVESVKAYLEQQARHHGYDKRILPPVFRYRSKSVAPLTASHAVFELTHHLVFSTRYRVGIFDSTLGEGLSKYWLSVADKRGFAIEQMSIVPDHMHLIVKTVPKMSVEECALALMNNGQYFLGKHFSSSLVKAGIERVWQPSAYVGTCGQMTTALLKSFLSRTEEAGS